MSFCVCFHGVVAVGFWVIGSNGTHNFRLWEGFLHGFLLVELKLIEEYFAILRTRLIHDWNILTVLTFQIKFKITEVVTVLVVFEREESQIDLFFGGRF